MNKEDVLDDASQMEINISNTNSNSQIVLNDLRLLELLYMYPFLFNPSARCYGDPDYEEWGWQQITECFNLSYEGIELIAPFSVEELKWRWENLRPICPSLVKACGQIPDPLWYIVVKINRLMTTKSTKTNPPNTATQKLILDQVSLVEQLTVAQRKSLEVEVMDAILTHERVLRTGRQMSNKTKELVKYQYDEFLKAIRVKELPCILSQQTKENSTSSHIKDTSNMPIIVNSMESNLVISSVCSAQTLQLSPPHELPRTQTSVGKSALFKMEPHERLEISRSRREMTASNHFYVPPQFKKKLRVLVKRVDLEEFKPLASIKRGSNEEEIVG